MNENEILTHLAVRTFAAESRGDEDGAAIADALYEMYDHGLVNVSSYDEDGEPLFVLSEFACEEEWKEAFEDYSAEGDC